jgi:micrococcal nuclease
MKAKILAVIAFVIFLILTSVLTGFFLKSSAFVVRVIDGDTIEIEGGQKVRLLGINAPEKGQAFYEQAIKKLKIIENKTVILESDFEDRDRYNRLLRWIWYDGQLINTQLVAEGLAFSYMAEGTKYEEQINTAQKQAQQAGLGLWSIPESNFSRCIGIQIFEWNAPGDDRYNLNGEYVTFKNACNYPINMTGWILADSSNNRFVFPQFIVQSLSKVTVYTGSGQNNETALFWSSSKPIWNNDGDSLYLKDSNGNTILYWSYTGLGK